MAFHYLADRALDDLLCTWRHYDDVQKSERATIADLGRARMLLDDARERMHRIRRASYPNASELSRAVKVAICPTLDEVVYLGWDDLVPGSPRALRCICGQVVEVDRIEA